MVKTISKANELYDTNGDVGTLKTVGGQWGARNTSAEIAVRKCKILTKILPHSTWTDFQENVSYSFCKLAIFLSKIYFSCRPPEVY